jgi:hypothetical protein
MSPFTNRAGLAATALAGALLLIPAARAADTVGGTHPAKPALAAATMPDTQAGGRGAMRHHNAVARDAGTPTERVNARITELHQKLRITGAQETKFDAMAEIMRSNAQAMETQREQRGDVRTLTAVDDLKSFQTMAQQHADGLKKLVPAFEDLYSSLSDEQKRSADALFARRINEHEQRARAGNHAS